MKILLILNAVMVLAAAGVVFYSHTMVKAPATNQAAEAEDLKNKAQASSQLTPVPIKKIVVNLHSKSTRLRYLDIEMNVLTFHEEEKEIVKASEHIFKDSVVEVASSLNPEDLDTVTGKILFEKKLKDKVNAKIQQVNSQLSQPVVKQIFFSGFVVQ